MDAGTIIVIGLLFALAAALYSSVGHGGASAYLATMALFGLAPETMRPTALALNLVVSSLAAFRYVSRGRFNPRLFLAFAATAMPCAFLGGRIDLPTEIYRPVVGILLWAAAARLLWQPKALAEHVVQAPALPITLPTGALLGLLAGLTGTGGGIFLSPLIILFHWEEPRRTSGIAAAFIFVNSAAGLVGNLSSVSGLPPALPWWIVAVVAGAVLGTWLGVDRLPRPRLLQALGLVLTVAGVKLVFA